MTLTCPICGAQTIEVYEEGGFDIHGNVETYVVMEQDCDCPLSTAQDDALTGQYDPEEHMRQYDEAHGNRYVLVEM